MSDLFLQLQNWLIALSNVVSVEWFTVIGAFVEEAIAPIPSPIIMMTSGVMVQSQGSPVIYLLWIAFIGAIAKTLASWILYIVADKLEDVFLGKFGKFFGVDHNLVESIGKKFNRGIRDYVTIFFLRAIPVVPSAPISVLAGFFKVNFKAYLVGTFTGTIVRNLIYLCIGFSGVEFIEKYHQGLVSSEGYVEIGLVVLVFVAIVWYKFLRK